MDKELKDKLFVIPDFLEDADDETKHIYRKWLSVSYKIDNHELRFFDVVNKKGEIKTFDAKGNGNLQYKNVKKFGASDAEAEEVKRRCLIIQELQQEKANYNRQWQKRVFKRKKGEKSLLAIRSQEVMDMFGKFYTADEVQATIRDKWGMALNLNDIRKFYSDYKDKIEKLKSKYVLEGKDVRLATDAGRLELLSKLAWEVEKKFDKHKGMEASKELRAIIEQIRKEVKGEEIKLTIDGRIDVNATIQANQTLNEVLQQLPINMIVVGLTAVKQGINPVGLMGLLANSYYSKFNGFNKLHDPKDIELPGKFIKMYDWNDIKKKNEEETIDVEPIEVMESKVVKDSQFHVGKNKILQKLEELKKIQDS